MKTPEQIRLEAVLMQKELAELAGVSSATVSRVEAGNLRRIRALTINKIGHALQVRFLEQKKTFRVETYIEAVLCACGRKKFSGGA